MDDHPSPEAHQQPRRSRLPRTLRLLLVDTALFAAFVLVMNVPFTGLAIHEWLGIAVGAIVVGHLVQHSDWVLTTSQRLLTRGSLRNRLNYLMLGLLFLAFGTIIVSGLAISEVALPWLGVTPVASDFWLWLHLSSINWVMWLTALHLALNWKWIVGALRRFVLRPVMSLVALLGLPTP